MNTRISAYVIDKDRIEIIKNEIPPVKDNGIAVKVHSCAICGSDIRILKYGNERVKYPQIMGHEIAGEVIEIGKNVSKFKVGDRVCIGADVPCGECDKCKNGYGNCCDINYAIGYQFEGGFTEIQVIEPLVVDYGPIHKIPENVSYDEAVFAEPLACCINGYERVLINQQPKNPSVVIFGAGPIGTLLAMLAPIYNAKNVIVIDKNKNRLDMLKRNCNFVSIVNFSTIEQCISEILTLTNGEGANIIFTACSDPITHEIGIKVLSKRGIINLFGGLRKEARAISLFSNDIHYKEAYLTGSHGSTPEQHKKAIKLIEENKINVKALISDVFPLHKIHTAFEKVVEASSLKIIIHPQDQKEKNNNV